MDNCSARGASARSPLNPCEFCVERGLCRPTTHTLKKPAWPPGVFSFCKVGTNSTLVDSLSISSVGMLPFHLQSIVSRAKAVNIVADNARRSNTISATEEHYNRLSRPEPVFASFRIDSVPRPATPRGKKKKSLVRSRQPRGQQGHDGPTVSSSTSVDDRWDSSPKLPPTSPISVKGSFRPRVPVRRTSVETTFDSFRPRVPVRRTSVETTFDNTNTNNSQGPLSLPVRRSSDVRTNGGMSTSQLISQVMDELRLYDSDSDIEEGEEEEGTVSTADSTVLGLLS